MVQVMNYLQLNIVNRTVPFISLRTLGICHLVDKDEATPYRFVPNHSLVLDNAAKKLMRMDTSQQITFGCCFRLVCKSSLLLSLWVTYKPLMMGVEVVDCSGSVARFHELYMNFI